MNLPFIAETPLERAVVSDHDWRRGVLWGQPRPGHPEGSVLAHIVEVLRNVDAFYGGDPYRPALRLIALVHDSFKRQQRALSDGSSHGLLARRFAEHYVGDEGALEVIEWHDEAFKAWRLSDKKGDHEAAERRADALIARLGPHLDLFMAFYRCDSLTGDKTEEHCHWFMSRAGSSGPALTLGGNHEALPPVSADDRRAGVGGL